MALASSSGLWGGGRAPTKRLKSGTARRASSRRKARVPFLSPRIRVFLRNFVLKLVGVLCLILAGFVALALASWHAGDPSLNSVPLQGYETQNWLGIYGSYPADSFVQLFGRSVPFLLVMTFAVWGVRLMTRHRIGLLGVRGLFLLVALFLSALTLGAQSTFETDGLPLPIAWLVQVRMEWLHGGLIGTINPWLSGLLHGYVAWWLPMGVSLVAGVVAFGALLVAMTFSPVKIGRGFLRVIGQATYCVLAWTAAYCRDLVRDGVRVAFANLRAKVLAVRQTKQARAMRAIDHTDSHTSDGATETSKKFSLRSLWRVFNPLFWLGQLRRLLGLAFVPVRKLHGLQRTILSTRRNSRALRVEPQLGTTPDLTSGESSPVAAGDNTGGTIQAHTADNLADNLAGNSSGNLSGNLSGSPADTPSSGIEIRGPHPIDGLQATKTARVRARDKRREGGYALPQIDLLREISSYGAAPDPAVVRAEAERLERVLREFGVQGEIVRTHSGPIVTRYELRPAAGIKTSRVVSLADDIARSMSAVSARIAVVAGSDTIGIELPNAARETVALRALLQSSDYANARATLPIALGADISGKPVIADLSKMPHLLIAGTTGSGKSVSLQAILLSLLYRLSPDECKLIMVDPKMLELSIYDGIPHLISPVVTDPKKAVIALKWAVREMELRYQKMSRVGARNLNSYNERLAEMRARGETTRTVQTGSDPETGRPIFEEQQQDLESLPYIVVVVDEMADLMLIAGKEVEGAIQRLAQMARAAGIHLIMATQRPSVDVITGTVKANFPTRVSFHVTSKIDSRTILGEGGAEQLLGQGDMLHMAHGGRLSRVHGPFVSDKEVERVTDFLRAQGAPEYDESITAEPDEELSVAETAPLNGSGESDLYQRAKRVVSESGKISISYIQRRLEIGYNRAARLVEEMENEGFVSAPNSQGRREILG